MFFFFLELNNTVVVKKNIIIIINNNLRRRLSTTTKNNKTLKLRGKQVLQHMSCSQRWEDHYTYTNERSAAIFNNSHQPS